MSIRAIAAIAKRSVAIAVGNCLNQDFQDFRIYRMRDSVVNSSDRPYQIIERNDRPQFLRETQAIAVGICLNQDLQDEVFGG
ncbi:hypothetical protein [Aphanizomenon sp. UHCC 0183]|uniref:hypothetical protein n=1 Tax=Aphanizomenon sp. UHCC 0183 TaxID=2590028 RepID=UPI00144642B0|nr:hypothetical protein [Aphanizomenon sp. UHCC 0183]MTJ32590.1 hypothetical protein [Aphanizomenon sp. UHCC 0183]